MHSETSKKRPRIGVGAIVLRGREILLVRRGNEPSKGLWSLPGGKIEWGEPLEEAVVRETLEETSVAIRVDAMAGVFEIISPEGSSNPDYHFVAIDYLCSPVFGEPSPNDDAVEACWVPLSLLSEFPTTPHLVEKLTEWGVQLW